MHTSISSLSLTSGSPVT